MDSTQPGSPGKFDPMRCGIFRSLTAYGEATIGGALLNTRAWNYAVAEHRPVGDCRGCGYPVVGYPTEVVGNITWYSAVCTNPNCQKEIASPKGELLRRSSRWSEMPKGFMEGRKPGKAL